MASEKEKGRITPDKVSRALSLAAVVLCVSGFAILLLTYAPLIREEILYTVRLRSRAQSSSGTRKDITPIDTEFGIVIPKLGANARVLANVDPFNAKDYQYALTRGVAHARGTGLPGESGNIFLFAHSSENFYVATQYNAIFYLLDKLSDGDEIDLYYRDVKFVYQVTGKKFVNAKDVKYLNAKTTDQTLTLMTCWPPGTDIERLLIFASLKAQ